MPVNFADRLHAAVRSKQTAALVGLDPRFERLPAPVVRAAERRGAADENALKAAAFEEFCFRIIDVVAPLVPAVKPQAAFFEELGPAGMTVLQRVIRRAREASLIVICDAKRGDIGSTAEAYARAYLAGEDPNAAAWAADALTVNPYLGRDTLEPFVQVARERGAGIYVLVRTSNPEAGTFQDLETEGVPLYRAVAKMVETFAASTAERRRVRSHRSRCGRHLSGGACGTPGRHAARASISPRLRQPGSRSRRRDGRLHQRRVGGARQQLARHQFRPRTRPLRPRVRPRSLGTSRGSRHPPNDFRPRPGPRLNLLKLRDFAKSERLG